MFEANRIWACCFGALLLSTGFVAPPGQAHEVTVTSGGRERSGVVYVPRGIGAGPYAVLVAFHGGGGNAAGFRRTSGLDAVADREKFVLVYPDGTGGIAGRLHTWNAGGCCGSAARDGVDDVAFVWDLLGQIAPEIRLDPERVYITGHSNGSMMAYRVAAESARRVAAVVGVAGAMQLDDFDPEVPVPVLHIHSVDDPRALYAGGLGPPSPLTRRRVEHRPVEGELGRWLKNNGCDSSSEVLEQRRWTAADGAEHRAEHLQYGPCSGAPVQMWRLHGAGHAWPGGRASALVSRLVGPETEVIDAGVEVWSFVSRFRRSGAPPLAEGS